MTTTTTETQTKTKTCLKPNRLLLKPDNILLKSEVASPVIAMPNIPSSPITTGTFYLPIKQKNGRKGRYHQKHLRKPPSFDTYLNASNVSSTSTTCGYYTRTPSISSSYSSTSSLADNEDVMCGYGYKSNNISTSSLHYPRLRRGSSAAFKVRFAEDDVSSILSSVSSSSGADDWDDIEDEDEEDYILVPQHPPRHFYNYHKKGGSS